MSTSKSSARRAYLYVNKQFIDPVRALNTPAVPAVVINLRK